MRSFTFWEDFPFRLSCLVATHKLSPSKNDKETISKTSADGVKLGNLLKRHRVYGDITQNATESQLERLLVSISDNIIAKLGRILVDELKHSGHYHMFSCF